LPREVIDRREGRHLFGTDAVAYDQARPGHPEGVYEVLAERCGLSDGTRVLEVGPGTGQATRRLLELGARPLVTVEPDAALAEYLTSATSGRPEIVAAPLEEADLPAGSFDLAVAASSFHWVEEAEGLAKIASALRPGGWWAMWWTLFGDDERRDAFITAIDPLFADLARGPGSAREGRPSFALDSEARLAALSAAGFERLEHQLIPWSRSWDTDGIRTLYSTFSPIRRLDERRREAVLDEVARIAEHEFGGRVEKPLRTSLYTARHPG
jgi:SAM-dependent methyltransferase